MSAQPKSAAAKEGKETLAPAIYAQLAKAALSMDLPVRATDHE